MSKESQAMDFEDELDATDGSMEQIDLQHYLRILRKNKWPISLFTALVTCLAAYYAYTATPIYKSQSTLLIESQKANIVSIEDLYGVEKENGDYYQTQYEILKSRALAGRVVKAIGDERILNNGHRARSKTREEASLEEPAEAEFVSTDSSLQTPSKAEAVVSSVREKLTVLFNGASSVESTDPTIVDDLAGQPTTESESPKFDRAVGSFRSHLSISPIRKTKLVRIGFESSNPDFAALVANTVAEEYITSVLDARMEMKAKATNWMNDRVTALKAKLDVSESKLIAFKKDNGLIDVNGSVGRLNEQELLLATAELAQARSELSNNRDLYREVTNLQRSAPHLLETLPAIQNDPLVRSVKLEFGQRQREFDELSNRYGQRHPKIVDAQSRLDSLRKTMDGHINRAVSAIKKDYEFKRQRVASIQSTLASGKEKIQVIGQKKFKLDALEREVETNREVYNQYYNRITETNSADGLNEANARISDYAVSAGWPIKPKKQLIIAAAALASLVLSALLALLYEQLDETIKSTHDVEKKLGVDVLGILPLIGKGILGGRKELPLNPLDIEDKKGTFVESVNTVRTALALEDSGGTKKVILVTSSLPGEGKSTAAMNLAFSFSQLEKVLLIDCDLRRPSLAKAIGIDKSSAGLSNLITKTASGKECVRQNAIAGMDVLTSGPMPKQPLELLSSSRFAHIVEQLKGHYDRIIIDSAPTQAVSDSLVLSRLVDSVVYVVKSHDTSYNLVKRGLTRLTQVDAPVAGVIISQVDIEKITSYGGDYYYQGYYDYYGYNSTNEKKTDKLSLTPEELRRMKSEDAYEDIEFGFQPEASVAAVNFESHSNAAVANDIGEKPVTEKKILEGKSTTSKLDWEISEFDLTTQITDENRASIERAGLRKNNRFVDDLDML